jgi:hypothetical protein
MPSCTPTMPDPLDRDIEIPFGAARWPAGGDRHTAPCVRVDPGRRQPLRLNGDQWDFAQRDFTMAPALADPEGQLAYVREHLKRYCDLWRRSQKLFLDRYFAFVVDHVMENRAPLSRRLEPFGGLFDYRDWALSALRPLPRAHLPSRAVPGQAVTWIGVDFAFWTGVSPLAINLVGSETRGAPVERRLARLRRSGATVVEMSEKLLRPGHEAAFGAALPKALHRFWEGETMPSGPFKPTGLDSAELG